MGIDNEVREENIEDILRALGYGTDDQIEAYFPKSDLEASPGLESELGNEIMFLRDYGVLDVRIREDDLYVKIVEEEKSIIGQYEDIDSGPYVDDSMLVEVERDLEEKIEASEAVRDNSRYGNNPWKP